MKYFYLFFLSSLIILVIILPTNVKGQTEDEEFFDYNMIPLSESKYLGFLEIQVRNFNDQIVSTAGCNAITFYQSPLTEYYIYSKTTVGAYEINDKVYERMEFVTKSNPYKFKSFSSFTQFDLVIDGNHFPAFNAYHNGVSVEEGDTITSTWIILRPLN